MTYCDRLYICVFESREDIPTPLEVGVFMRENIGDPSPFLDKPFQTVFLGSRKSSVTEDKEIGQMDTPPHLAVLFASKS